jgi:hypothetical protein
VEGSLKSQGDTAEVSTPRCAAHAAAATHRCDGCGELLCEKCIEVGHRLLFCVLCGERATELGALLVLVLMTMVPGVALVSLAGCDVGHVAAERRCVLLTGVGLLAGLMVLVPALGATASFGNSWLAVRWDLHLRAFARTWRDSTRLALGLAGLYLLGTALGRLFSFVPAVGGFLQLAIHVYAWFLGMHLVGLLVRRHEAELEPIYFD